MNGRQCQKLPSAGEARVEQEGDGLAEAEFGELGMGRIEEEVGFGGDDDAGDLEDGRGRTSEPGVAYGVSASWCRIGAPVLRKSGRGETFDEVRRDGDGDCEIVAEECFGIEMDKNFEGGERLGLRSVDDGVARGVPAATEEARAFAGEGDLGESAVDDSPSDRVHRKAATLTGRCRARVGR
jgi:hypothetical protein